MEKLLKGKLQLFLVALSFPVLLAAQNNNQAKLANQFFKSGAYQKASELYVKLYNTHKSTNYYQGLLDCYLALSKLEEAEKLVKKQSKRNPTQISITIDYAHVHSLKGELKKATKKFKLALNQLDKNEQFVAVTANRLYKFEYFDYAIEAYKIGLRNPNQTNYRFQLAKIYGQQGKVGLMYENYLELIVRNKKYIQSVKNIINRTINNDPENENNQLLKGILLQKVQETEDENLAEFLIWLFIQEKDFQAAFEQEKAMDKRLKLGQKKLFELASICRKNKDFETAKNCYAYIINLGTESKYYLDAQTALLRVKKELLEGQPKTNKEDWLLLEQEYLTSFSALGKTSYTILQLRDLAQIQAFNLYDLNKASSTIKEALKINAASDEDIAQCKLVYADILLLQNEIWDAILYYSQVDKAYKHDVLGHEAKFRRAKISYYQGDFDWAQAQLDVLKKSTAKLIANNAMELALLIQDNLNMDTTTVTMELFAQADLFIYQNKLNEAYEIYDSIIINYQGHSLIDEALFRQFTIKMKQGKKEDASELLDQIIRFFSYDILADDAKFEQAQLQEYFYTDTTKALNLYQDIMTNHQDSFYLSESRKHYRELSK
jgi:tetratricopeptide (TPR) repeat protein